ncbi:hypothetical protein ABZZ36_35025 [Actinacidiphila glaucinigra]|uniref:hypothetical protein n=1 Tax=Actinacidiphila glaucinigra TaxID=235986 RepID=UPI0033BB6B75
MISTPCHHRPVLIRIMEELTGVPVDHWGLARGDDVPLAVFLARAHGTAHASQGFVVGTLADQLGVGASHPKRCCGDGHAQRSQATAGFGQGVGGEPPGVASVEPVPADLSQYLVEERARVELRGQLATLLMGR